MDVTQLRRDPAAIAKTLVEVGNTTSTKTGCSIQIPSKYAEKGMAVLADNTYILGMFAIIVGDAYAVTKALALVHISPVESRRVVIDDEEYMQFEFPPGSVVIANKDVVQQDTLNYNVFDYHIDDGKRPWYISDDDHLMLFEHGRKFTGVTIAAHPSVLSILASVNLRDPDNKMLFYRQAVKSMADKKRKKAATVPFHSTIYGPRSTLAKLSGPYFNDGLTSSLLHPTDRVDPIEKILRKKS